MSEHASRSLCHSWAVCYLLQLLCNSVVCLSVLHVSCMHVDVYPFCCLWATLFKMIDRYYNSIKSKLHWLNLPHSSIGYYRRHWLPMIQWKTICSQELSLIVMWWKDRGGDWRHRSEVKVVNGRSVLKNNYGLRIERLQRSTGGHCTIV